MLRRFSRLLLRLSSNSTPTLKTAYLDDPSFCHRNDPVTADALRFITENKNDLPLAAQIQSYTFPFYQTSALLGFPQDKTFPETWTPLAFLAGIFSAKENRDLVKSLLQQDPRFDSLAGEATRICQLFAHEIDLEKKSVPLSKLQNSFARLTRQTFRPHPKTPLPTQIRASSEVALRIGFLAGLRQDPLTARLHQTIQHLPPHQQLLIASIADGQRLPLIELKKPPLLRLCRLHFSSHKNHSLCLEQALLQLIKGKSVSPSRDARRWSQESFLLGQSLNQKQPEMTYFLIEEWGIKKTEQIARLLQDLEAESKRRRQPDELIRFLHFPSPTGTPGALLDHLLRIVETSYALGLIQSLRDQGNTHRPPLSIKDLEYLWKRPK